MSGQRNTLLGFITELKDPTKYLKYDPRDEIMGIPDGTKVKIPCLIDGCDGIITAEFENGYPATYDDPGLSDFWYPASHQKSKDGIPSTDHEHLELISVTKSTAFDEACHKEFGS